MTTTFNISSAADLSSAIAEISSGGASAATNTSYTFNFLTGFTLDRALGSISLLAASSLTIRGGNFTMDGANAFGGFMVMSGSVSIDHLTIANTVQRGGDGEDGKMWVNAVGGNPTNGGGGGGAGLGGGLFVAAGSNVTLDTVSFSGNRAVGGDGGDASRTWPTETGGPHFAGGGQLNGVGALTPAATNGAFGDGGGGSAISGTSTNDYSGQPSGDGGFGGGGGGGFPLSYPYVSDRAQGGWGGGIGGLYALGADRSPGGGGGGLGAGGAIFVQEGGNLTIAGAGSISGGSATGGARGYTTPETSSNASMQAAAGMGVGSGLFLQGNQSLTFAPAAGVTQTISDTIADQGYFSGAGYGYGKLVVNGYGTLVLSAANLFGGGILVNDGTLSLLNSAAAGSGAITLRDHGTLRLGAAVDPANIIKGFDGGDAFSFTSYSATSLSFNYSTNVLSVTNGSATRTIYLDPTRNYTGTHFVATSDGSGGTTVTLGNLLVNGDFDATDLSSGASGVTVDAAGGNYTQAAPTGWVSSGGTGTQAPVASQLAAFADGNNNVAYLNAGASLSQTFNQVGTYRNYDFAVDIGRRTNVAGTTGVVKIFAGSDLIAQQAFDTTSLSAGTVMHLFLSGEILAANLGQPIRIEIQNTGAAQIFIDNAVAAGANLLNQPTISVAGATMAIEGGAAVTVLSGAPAITSSLGTLDSATVWISDFKAGDILAAATAGTTITASYANGVLTLSGTDTVAHYAQVLASVTYRDTGHDTATSGRPERHLSWSIDDGTLNATAPMQIEVAINRVPDTTNIAVIPGIASYVGHITQSAPDYDGDGVAILSFEGSAANVGGYMAGSFGVLRLSADGSYEYIPNAGVLQQTGVKHDSFTYTVQDSTGHTVDVTLDVAILGPRITTADLTANAAAIAANPAVPFSIVDTAANIASHAAAIDALTGAGRILSQQVVDGAGNIVSTTYFINNAEDLNAALAEINQGGDRATATPAFTFEFLNSFILDRQLTPINLDAAATLVINGNGFEMNGADTYGGFVARSGNISIDGLGIVHTTQRGGDGEASHYGSGGGGGGFGGGLLVFAEAAVELGDVWFDGNRAIGGNGYNLIYGRPGGAGGQLNGFLGGGGAAGFVLGQGGVPGGFGGGGGDGQGVGAAGGFGGGAGGSGDQIPYRAPPQFSEFGGGAGYGGAGGGAGLGGAIFVQEGGTLSFTGSAAISGGSAIGGTGITYLYDGNGVGLGSGIFLQGNQTLTFSPEVGETQTIGGSIYIQTGGAIVLDGPGTLALGAGNSVAATTINEGTLALLATGAAGNGTLNFAARAQGTLAIGANADVGNTIVGFDMTDAIDLAGYGGSIRFYVAPNSNVLQVTNGTLTEFLTFDHTVNASQFSATSDGIGGALITLRNLLTDGTFRAVDLSTGAAGVMVDAVHGNHTATAPSGWTGTGSVGAMAPTAAVSPDFANSQVAYLDGGASLWQTFTQASHFYQYQVSLDLGRRLDATAATTGIIKVYAGSDLIGTQSFDTGNIAPGAVTHLTLTTNGLAEAQFAQPIRVEIDNTGSGQVLLDNVLASPMRPLTYEIASALDFNNALVSINAGGADAIANVHYTFNFANGFTLDSNLDTINLLSSASLTINGGGFTIDGASAFGSFEITSGALEINDIAIHNTVARGDNASNYNGGNGGGGAGVGGGLFVGSGASAVLSDVNFSGTAAVGGNGSSGGQFSEGGPGFGAAGSVPGATFTGGNGSQIGGGALITGGAGGGINGWGGGHGTTGGLWADPGGSGGGGAFGGAIFVQDGGSLSIAGDLDISGASLTHGLGYNGGGFGGEYGAGIFLADNRPLILAPEAGAVQTISGQIDDQYDHGRLVLDGRGTLVLSTANLFGGGVTINGGTLSLATATSAGTGGIAFGANKSGALELAAGIDTANIISGFTSDDVIRLVGFGAATTFSFGADRVLTVGNGTDTVTLEFDPLGGLVASQLEAVSDGNGGTLITFANLLTDGNFQAVDLSTGAAGVVVDAVHGNHTMTAPSGWTGSGNVGTLAPTAAVSSGLGSNVATLGGGASMSQSFAAPGDYNNYDIALDIGRRLDDTSPTTGVVKVYAGSTLIDTQTFDTSSIAPGATVHIAFTSDGVGIANLDQPIRIEIENTGTGPLLVDNVFAASANPVPTATMSVVAADVHTQTIQFNVSFSSSVTGVDANAFSIVANGISGATITSITQTGASHYLVTVTAGTVTDNDSIGSVQLVLTGGNVTSLTGAPYDSRGDVSAARDVSNIFVIADAEDFNAAVALINAGGGASAANSHYIFDIQDSFTLDRSLAHIQLLSSASLSIVGHDETLDGADAFGGLTILSGTVSVEYLTLSHMKTAGGTGQSGSYNDQIAAGGGGAGLGGALFVGAGASVTLDTVDFAGNQAVGGAGGSSHGFGPDYYWDWASPIGSGGGLNGADGGAYFDLQAGVFRDAAFGGGGMGANGVLAAGIDGAFGGGGGGWAPLYNLSGGAGGWGAGSGGNIAEGEYPPGGGGGGLGAGGAVFVQQGGSLTIRGDGAIDGGAVTAGLGGGDGAQNGSAFGSGLFLQGNQSLTFAPATGETFTISEVIADQAGSIATTTGAASLILDGLGTLALSAANTFTGGVTIKGGTLSLMNDTGAGSGAITFAMTAQGTLHLGADIDIDNIIKGFNTDDRLDLAGFGAGTTAFFDADNVLTVTYGGTIETFQFDPTAAYGAYLAQTTADGSGGSYVAIALNGGPTATRAIATYAATEREALTLAGTGLSVADADDVGAINRITLSVGQGQLDATVGASGVTIVSGNGTSSLVIDGTIAQLDAFLASDTLSYINYNDDPDLATTLTLKIDDRSNIGGILSTTATATIDITPVNNAPVAVIAPTSYAATEQTTLSLKNSGLSVNDVDGNLGVVTVTLSVGEGSLDVTAGGSGATVSGSGGSAVTITGTLAQINALFNADASSTLSYLNTSDTPAAHVTLTLLVNDRGNTGSGGALIASDTADIAVAAVNDIPVLSANTAPTLAEGGSTTITAALLDVNDADNTDAQLTYTITTATAHGTLMRDGVALGLGATLTQREINTNRITYVHDGGETVSDEFGFSVSDDAGGTITGETFTFAITPVNDAPVATDGSFSGSEDTIITGTLSASDPEGSALTYARFRQAQHGTVVVNADGTFTYTPDAGFGGADSFAYTVSDGSLTDNGTVSIRVNGRPVAVGDTFTTVRDIPVTFDVRANDTDANGDVLTVTQVNGMDIFAHAPVTLHDGFGDIIGIIVLGSDGNLTFTPTAGYNGPVNFTYTVSDGSLTDTGAVSGTITVPPVTPVNRAPFAHGDVFTMPQDGGAVAVDVRANDGDPDNDLLHITAIGGHAIVAGGSAAVDGGMVTLTADGRLIFTHAEGHSGPAIFSYTVADAAGAEASAIVTSSAVLLSVLLQLKDVLGEHGLSVGDPQTLVSILSVVAPGVLEDAHISDADALLGTLASLAVGLSDTAPGLVSPGTAGDWLSASDQSLLFQAVSPGGHDVELQLGDTAAAFGSGVPADGVWSREFALKALRSDFSASTITAQDGHAQANAHQADVADGARLGMKIDGMAAGAPHAGLTSPFGLMDYASADGDNAVNVSRLVTHAQTLGGTDDQDMLVRLRQSGMQDVKLMFYAVDDDFGTVDGLRPGDAGYDAASRAHAYLTDMGATWVSGAGYGQYGEATITGVDSGDLIAMRLSAGGHDFYMFLQANEQANGASVNHVWNYGLNTWGWEDLYGGGDRDFNDLLVQMDFVSPAIHDTIM
ncbi:Ig-like domain-containing protein [Aquabacter sp. CN5-332]|uniref:Ig-like domain-containing protein n=1 Tax=Aquabacter sp. CN5-332 TaxID=3156608 RepID=UPI0032B46B54